MGFWRGVLTGRSDPILDAAIDEAADQAGPAFGATVVDPTAVDVPPEVFGLAPLDSSSTAPAPRVSRRQAVQVAAVKRSRDLIAGSIGQLPLVTVKADLSVDRTSWLTQPEADVARSVTMTRTAEDLLYEGIAWWKVTAFDWRGYPAQVVRLDPRTVDVMPDQRVRVTLKGNRGTSEQWPTDGELIRFDSPNDALLVAGARAIRQCLTLDVAAQRYADGAPPLDYFTPAEAGVDPGTEEEIRGALDAWQAARQQRATGYVPATLKYNLGGWNPEQLELADQRQHAVLEIARVAGVDPEELGVSTTSRTYANQFDRRKAFLDFTLGPYRAAIEDRLSMGDITPRGTVTRFDLDAFLRTDAKTRYEAAKLGIEVGALTKAEVREDERRPALPADLATAPTSTPGDPVRTTIPDVAAHDDAPAITLTFDTDPAVTLDAAASDTFEVNAEARTIRGLAVPYGKVGVSNGQRFQFSRGTLKFADVRRVKLWVQHDRNQAVGVATKLDDREDGLHAEFSVARGVEGDRILSLAEDGVLDGLSIGLGRGAQFATRDGVQHAVAGGVPLMEISLTPAPSFDDARLVGAGAGFGADQPGATFEGLGTEIRKAMFQGFTDMGGAPQRQTVSAGGPRFDVEEPAPYRFDGQQGEHDFSHDVIATMRGDHDARERVQTFMAEELDPATFAIGTADVADLTPPRQRPDLYVDRLVAATPLWLALRKGALTDSTPFIFPRFGSAEGLVDDHETMVEPTPGSFTAGKQTVTPSPLSGKVEIPREIVDAGGNPQVSALIWREMQRAYYEALETKVADLLAATNPGQINLTAGATDAALVDELEAAYAALQFVPGGFRFDYAPTHQGLYTALAAAADDAGRKLLPITAPANANGSAASRFASLNVAGVQHLPVASLGAPGVGLKRSYLLASEDVHAWASPPRELRFEYQVAHVDLGIWGYAATAVSRADGVRRISYDTEAV